MEHDEQRPRYKKHDSSIPIGKTNNSNHRRSTRNFASSNNHHFDHVKKGFISSIIDTFCKILFMLTISISLAFFVLVFVNTTNNDDLHQGGRVQTLSKIRKDSESSGITNQWENIKYRAMSVYFATTASIDQIHDFMSTSSSSTMQRRRRHQQQMTMDKVELGQRLLKNGDPVGAETLCKHEIDYIHKNKKKRKKMKKNDDEQDIMDGDHLENESNEVYEDEDDYHTNIHPKFIQALVCLGEARLALHNTAWNSGLILESSSSSSSSLSEQPYERLHLANQNFDEAVRLQPTNMNARLGLGLTYFLIATREQQYSNNQSNKDTATTRQHQQQLLFNSILHFEAIGVLVSSSSYDYNTVIIADEEEIENMKISALYNNALAHIALDDVKSAIPILNDVSKILEMKKKELSPHETMMLSSVKANLGAALLLQRRSDVTDHAIKVMDGSNVRQYCKPEGIDIDEFDTLPYWKQRMMQKQCSILLNNLAIANERGGKNNEITNGDDNNDDDDNDEHQTTFQELALSYEHMLSLESPSFATMNAIAQYGGKPQLTINIDSDGVQYAALEAKKDGKIYTIDALLTMSNTKMTMGDIEGAIDVARKALNQATNLDEIKLCTEALESALKETNMDQKNNLKEDSEEAEKSTILRLEEEIVLLKQQLKEQHKKPYENRAGGAFFNTFRESDQIRGSEMLDNEEVTVTADATNDDKMEEISNTTEELQDVGAGSVKHNEEDVTDSLDISSDESNAVEEKGTAIVIETEEEAPKVDNATILMQQSGDSNKDEIISVFDQTQDDIKDSPTIDDIPKMDDSDSLKDSDNITTVEESSDLVEDETDEEIILPSLFTPDVKEPEPVDASAEGYMKVADAYIQKENYKLASKQFLKVLKKNKHHIPALLGYATSMERHVKPKQMKDVAMAYANVTLRALEQGNSNLATATFRRSLNVSEGTGEGEKLEILQYLSTICFNEDVAAQIYYEIGLELLKTKSSHSEAINAFKTSDAFGATSDSLYSSMSKFQIAKLKQMKNENLGTALELVQTAISHGVGDLQIEALVLSGEIKETLSDIDGAIKDYEKATEFPNTDASSIAHYNLGLALKSIDGDLKSIENHIEVALNLGYDPTPEAIEILGEHHIAIVKSAHRAEWNQYKQTLAESNDRGGIMTGSGLSSESVFATKDTGASESDIDTLSMLEQGAAAYDGSVPSGDETIEEASTITNHQRSTSSKVNTN